MEEEMRRVPETTKREVKPWKPRERRVLRNEESQ